MFDPVEIVGKFTLFAVAGGVVTVVATGDWCGLFAALAAVITVAWVADGYMK